jgi:hypothetical protein
MAPGEVVGIGVDLTPLYAMLLNSSGFYLSHPGSPIGKFSDVIAVLSQSEGGVLS